MESVGAGDDGGVELTTGGVAEFGRKLVGDEGEVTDGVVGHVDERTGNCLVVVVDTFDGEVVVAGTLTADGGADADADAAGGGNAGAKQRRVQHAEADGGGGQAGKLFGGEGRGEVRGRGVENHAGVGGDFNRLGGTYRENDVLRGGLVDVDHKARELIGLESGVRDLYVI